MTLFLVAACYDDLGRRFAKTLTGDAEPDVVTLSLVELVREIRRGAQPGIVMSWLVGAQTDAVEIAAKLEELAYRGPYYALALDLPNRAMVMREIRAAAPRLIFEVVEIPQHLDTAS